MYTKERAVEVRRRVRENGERVTAVCVDMGMNFENLLRWCRRNNFKVHSKQSRARAARLPRGSYALGQKVDRIIKPRKGSRAAAIIADWKLGQLTPHELAKKHEVCYAYVIRLRKRAGLNPPSGKGRNVKNPWHIRKGSAQRMKRNLAIKAELENGLSPKETALKYGVSRETVRAVRIKLGQ